MHFFEELTGPTLVVALFCSLGGLSFGIDFGYWSGVLGMEQFAKVFGTYNASEDNYHIPSSWKSAGSGLPMAGLAMGALLSGFVGRPLGRVRTLQLSYVIALVGVVIQSTAITSYWQITVGRIITAVALGILANTVPAYLAEVAPLSVRGTLVNFYQFSIGVGAVLVATCNWGLYQRTDQWAYRTPIILQAVLPLVFLAGSFFMPESPRWLLGIGKADEARRELERLRPRADRDIIDQEIQLIAAAEEENKALSHGTWLDCFSNTNLRRTLIMIGVQSFQQAQGISFMSQYSVVFFQAIGFEDAYMINVLMSMCMAISSAFAFYLPDRFGRRWIMIVSAIIMAASLCSVAGITGFGPQATSKSTLNGAMAAIFLWQIFTSIGWSSCVWIITAEVPTLVLREKSITIATVCGFCVSVLISFVSPYIQDKGYGGLEGRIGLLYGGMSVAAAVWAFLFVPETGSRGLEELDELFRNQVSVFKFNRYETSGIGAQIHIVEGMPHQRQLVDKEAMEEKAAEAAQMS